MFIPFPIAGTVRARQAWYLIFCEMGYEPSTSKQVRHYDTGYFIDVIAISLLASFLSFPVSVVPAVGPVGRHSRRVCRRLFLFFSFFWNPKSNKDRKEAEKHMHQEHRKYHQLRAFTSEQNKS